MSNDTYAYIDIPGVGLKKVLVGSVGADVADFGSLTDVFVTLDSGKKALMTLNVGTAASEVLEGYLDGMSQQRQELWPVVDGGEVFLDINAIGGKDIDYYINGQKWTLDCTTGDGTGGRARVQLLQGLSDEPQPNNIYVAVSENNGEEELQLFTSSVPPDTDFAWVAYAVILDDVKTNAEDPLVLQRTTEAVEHNGRGGISWERESIRFGAGLNRLLDGCDQNFHIETNAGSEDNLLLETANGIVFQLHRQGWQNYDIATQGIWVSNSEGAGGFDNYTRFTDLNQALHELQDGTTLNDGDSINYFVWGAINYGFASKLFLNLSPRKFTVDADAIADTNTDYFKIPKIFQSVAFPLMRGILKWNTAASGTWSNLLTATVDTWQSKAIISSTTNYPGNYPNNMDIIQTFSETGAIKVRMIMRDFNTESNYDFAEFKDATDPFSASVTARRTSPVAFSGNLAPFTSPEIVGDTIRVNYTSDGSVQRSGAESLVLEYLKAAAGAGSEIKDLRGTSPEFIF